MSAAPATARKTSLAYLTAAPLLPPEMIRLAARVGYDHVGLRALPALPGGGFSPLIEDRALMAATRAAITETGITVFDMEIIRLDSGFALETVKPFLEIAGLLGARAILVAGDDPDRARLTANYAAFCEAAAAHGLTADLEFMPWTPTASCNDARRIVEAAAQPNGRILVDALHAARSATSLDDLRALPRALLSYVQICDAPAAIPTTREGLLHTARSERLLPGDGGIDLTGMLNALPGDLPVSIELPHDVMKARIGIEAWARQGLDATRRILAGG